jgi:hypothetical protein
VVAAAEAQLSKPGGARQTCAGRIAPRRFSAAFKSLTAMVKADNPDWDAGAS